MEAFGRGLIKMRGPDQQTEKASPNYVIIWDEDRNLYIMTNFFLKTKIEYRGEVALRIHKQKFDRQR